MSDHFNEASGEKHLQRLRAMPPIHRARAALSQLFLDTEHDELAIASIAERLLETKLSLEEITRIYENEVAPILRGNFYSVAGVWDGFDVEWLNAEIERRRVKRKSMWSSLFQSRQRATSHPEWDAVRAWLSQPEALARTLERLRST